MIIKELLQTLYSEGSPYDDVDLTYADRSYPHTNVMPKLLDQLFELVDPTYIVECGSMTGGSVKIIADCSKRERDIICIDPFTGDVNMWAWTNNLSYTKYFLRLESGRPTIYNRFLANCVSDGLQHVVLPINCTANVGLKLLLRLKNERRISSLPNYIYIDSAHEPDETLIELRNGWSILQSPGVLFGDDFEWEGVNGDVRKFAAELNEDSINFDLMSQMVDQFPDSQIVDNRIFQLDYHWVIFKK